MSVRKALLEGDIFGEKKKQVIDKVVVVMILQNYIDSANH